MTNTAGFRFIDLFAGIGGFRLALDGLGGRCVFSSEIDPKARQTYAANFGGEPYGDIRELTGEDRSDAVIESGVPDHEVLAGGFPCQPFSLAGVSSRTALGRQHGLLDKSKGTLFFDICRIIKVKKPKIVFLENVSNIVNHDGGKTFEVIRSSLEEGLGYRLFCQVISSETLVPQKRRRCFFVAFRDVETDFKFPAFDGPPLPLKSALEAFVDARFTLSDRAWAGHQRRTKTNLARGAGFTAFTADPEKPSKTIVARYYKDGKECLVPQEGRNPRLLTPRECARLQGFPETFVINPSRSAAYKQFGNAVPVPVVKRVAKAFLKEAGLDQSALKELETGAYGRPDRQGRQVKEHGGDQKQKHQAGNRRQKTAA